MQSSMYSSVGFRCESAYLAFSSYLKNKQLNGTNSLIFEDSKKIINDCLQIEKTEDHSLHYDELKSIEIGSIQNILYDYIMAQEDKKAAFKKLKQIYTNIGDINNLKDVQVQELCIFFKAIVKLCKDRTQYDYPDDDSYWR